MNIQTLVLSGDRWHETKTVRHGLLPLIERGFDFTFFENGTKWPPEELLNFPIAVLAKANMISATDDRIWLTSDSEKAFQNHLGRGAALLIIHGGTSRYDDLPVMRKAIGGTFLSHPPQCAVTLEPKSSHRIAHGVTTFAVHDEHYFMAYDGAETDVFLHSRSEHGTQPAGWTRLVGGGRICVLTPGHNPEVWLHPEFQKLLLNALRWATEVD